MRHFFVALLCLVMVGPVSAQEVVLEAPASAEVTADGVIAVTSEIVEEAVSSEVVPEIVPEVVPEEVVPEVKTAALVPDTQEASPAVLAAWTAFVDALKSGSFPLIAGAFIFLLLAILKLPAAGAWTNKIPARYRVLLVTALSLLASVFDAVILGTPWGQALYAVLYIAPVAVFANEFFVETLMGKRYQKKG